MKTIFNKEDFTLCFVPVPSGYKQSQTHSGIAIHNGTFYLTSSPYPSGGESKFMAYFRAIQHKIGLKLIPPFVPEAWENPCLYIQSEENNGGYPIDFKLLQKTPLMSPPEPYYGLPAFNSDPDIFIENDTIHILNRQTYRTKICPGEPLNKYRNRIYHIYGKIDNKRFYYLGTELLLDSENMICSPSLTKFKGQYLLSELETNTYNEGDNFKGLFIASSSSISGLKDFKNCERVEVNSGEYLPWHMSLFSYREKLYTIIACIKKGVSHRLWQMLGEFSDDLSSLKIYQTPLTDYRSYRGAAIVDEHGEFILYNTTVHEKIKGGKSVDGREIIMAHMPFVELLEKIKNNER